MVIRGDGGLAMLKKSHRTLFSRELAPRSLRGNLSRRGAPLKLIFRVTGESGLGVDCDAMRGRQTKHTKILSTKGTKAFDGK